MKCPRCESVELLERDREGITVVGCPQCRGLWLDRGELERLVAKALSEDEVGSADLQSKRFAEETRARRNEASNARTDYRHDDDDDDDDHLRRDRHGRKPKRWYESLTDLFD
jgi:Zn-finger nucleic acid-binding protein